MNFLKKIDDKNSIILYSLLFVVLLLPIYFMTIDCVLSGDEVITYSMANNDEAGFVYSEGRVSSYLVNEVFVGNSEDVIRNLATLAKDVLINREEAKILNYPRNPEVQEYTEDEIYDWFNKRDDECFNVATTWLHSLSDDGNPWFYYMLVNVSSSSFPRISGSKWSAFAVNYLFYLLMVVVVYKLAAKLGNSREQSIVLMILIGVMYQTIGATVTNLRGYSVATFFAALVVVQAARIHKSLFENRGIATRDIVVLFISYCFGYVTHYTVGAVLLSFGMVLLFLAVIWHKQGTMKLILSGILAFMLGLLLSPESVVGLLKKLISDGAMSEKKGFTSNPTMMLLFVVTFLFLIILFIVIYRDNRKAGDSLVYISISSAVMMLIILIATNGYGYARVLFPIIYMIVFTWLCKALKWAKSHTKTKIIIGLAIVACIVFSTINLKYSYQDKMAQNLPGIKKVDVLDNYGSGTCIYFREHARGYADAQYLKGRVGRVQVITLDTSNWEQYVTYDFCDDVLLCYCTDGCYSQDILEWLKDKGYNINQSLYVDGSTNIFTVKK